MLSSFTAQPKCKLNGWMQNTQNRLVHEATSDPQTAAKGTAKEKSIAHSFSDSIAVASGVVPAIVSNNNDDSLNCDSNATTKAAAKTESERTPDYCTCRVHLLGVQRTPGGEHEPDLSGLDVVGRNNNKPW